MRLLHAAIPVVLMSTAGTVRADSFGEILAGLSIPVGDSKWTDTAESSPNIGVRAGATNDKGIGGMVQIDWTPINLDQSGGSFGVGSSDIAAHRFRFLADLVIQRHVTPKLVASGRVGLGLDIAHASASVTVLGNTTSSSDTNLGFGFEFGGGLWYDLGDDIQLGGELAIPIASHSKKGDNSDGNYTFDYTSYDFNLLFGARFLSR